MRISECETGDGEISKGRLKFALHAMHEGSLAARGEPGKGSFTGHHAHVER